MVFIYIKISIVKHFGWLRLSFVACKISPAQLIIANYVVIVLCIFNTKHITKSPLLTVPQVPHKMSLIKVNARFPIVVVGHKQFYCLIKFINKFGITALDVVTRFKRKSKF